MNKTHLFYLLVTVSIFSCGTQNISKTNFEKPARVVSDGNTARINAIDNLIKKLVSDKKTVGFSFGIQIGEATPIIKEYGLANLEKGLPVKSTDQFRIASVTKPITATAILKLVELGELSLNDRINKFFPDYPNGQNISIYQLLSHTSGIPNWWDGGMPGSTPKSFPMCDSPHMYLQQMKNGSLFAPSEFFKYSNSGYILLGEIIEIVSGIKYDEFLKKGHF
jgi:CubicO group peptidase (beta-lactamase class C family)